MLPASHAGMPEPKPRSRAARRADAETPSPRRSGRASRGAKRPFDFDVGLRRIREELKALDVADAAMFELKELGHGSVFEQLVACVISIRTLDEVMLPTARALFERAPTAAAMARLSVAEIDGLIRSATFHEGKARTIREIARRTAEEFGGTLPCDFDVLTSFHGVGPKCANLALGIACGHARIGVDIHVHRVTNR